LKILVRPSNISWGSDMFGKKKTLFGKRKTKPESISNILAALVAILIIVTLVNAYLVLNLPVRHVVAFPIETGGGEPVLPSLDDYVEVGVTTEPGVIYLNSGCTQLTMVTDIIQTESIQNGLDGKLGYRPSTHDILWDIIDSFSIRLSSVRVTRMQDGTYFANLILARGNYVLTLDSRPSDAIATAVRTDSPIYVKTDLMEEYGEWTC